MTQAHHERGARVLAIAAIAAMTLLMIWLVRTPVGDERIEWKAIAPPIDTPMHPWRWIVIHHSGWPKGDTASIDASHVRDRGWDGIGYHFVIGNGHPMPRGRVDATWRWKQQFHGAHAGSGPEQSPYNQDGIGICVIGNYDDEELDPYVERRLVELCALLIQHSPSLAPAHIIGHRDVPGKETDCPGKRVDIARLRFLVREEINRQELAGAK
jgi:N-acetyl-anhydromuramyl-L-alanine amidase AmpD